MKPRLFQIGDRVRVAARITPAMVEARHNEVRRLRENADLRAYGILTD